ncbi:MAG: bifunctional salicylyl-CoA 5-hydroxylase/oxidoreductase, partial [Nannocystaceae bacterium]
MKISVIGGGPGGLYFSLLMKKARPDCEIAIYERNRPNDTFGWGVVFSDETLSNFLEADPPTYAKITEDFVHWDAIDVHYRGEVVRSGGHGFSGIARRRLLQLLQERCAELGVQLHFDTEVQGPQQFADSDLVIAADGINSRTRTTLAEHFRPDVREGAAKFIWLGTTKVFDAFKFFFQRNEHGFFAVHAYPFDGQTSTFIVETDEDSWRAAGLDQLSVDEGVAYCERLFSQELGGHRLLTNKSSWINFRRVRNETWHHDNIVLIGDAAHTAHFSIGSGTKLAMEDAIVLVDALQRHEDIPTALQAYEDERWVDAAKLQKSAETSQRWFEEVKRYAHDPMPQLTMSLMSRSKRITHDNLRLRDPEFIARVDTWFAEQAGVGPRRPVPPPMFTPLTLLELTLDNRVMVSSIFMYSATEGVPDDWHLVHLGSRAVGGAGLVMAEMTDVTADGRISPGCTGLYDDAQVPAWRRVTDFVHRHSRAKIGVQLGHSGRKGSTGTLWDGYDLPLPEGNWELLAPSPLPLHPGRSQTPRPMTRQDMDEVLAAYVAATERALQADFDIIEVHMAHGYLLASFLSPLTNQRTDEYGGTVDNRLRFPLEVFDAVRRAWPDERPISVRISAFDWAPGGLTVAEAVEISRALKEHGADIIDVSSGQTVPHEQPEYGRMFQAPFADRIRHEVGIPTIAVGAILGWDHANTLLSSGKADLCAMARPHLFDPYLTLHAAAEQQYYDVHWP